jgi:hypothetical protein
MRAEVFDMNRWLSIKVACVSACVCLASVGGAEEPESRCRDVVGHFTVHTYNDMSCNSLVGLCGTVEWRGDLKASSSFVATAIVPTTDTVATGVVLATGDAALTLRDGTILTKDAVVLRTTGNGDFAEVDTIVGGTGAFAGATGAWHAFGTIHGNVGEGSYRGQICR